jgi:hypothetical protein
MAQANHTRTEKNNQQFPPIISRKTLDSSRYGGGIKSLLTSVAFPAFVLGHDPTKRLIVASYGLYGTFFVKGISHHFSCCYFILFVRPAPRAFFRPDRISPSPSRAATVKDGASSAPPKACP